MILKNLPKLQNRKSLNHLLELQMLKAIELARRIPLLQKGWQAQPDGVVTALKQNHA